MWGVDLASAQFAQSRLGRDDQDFVRAVGRRDTNPVPGAQVVESESFHDLSASEKSSFTIESDVCRHFMPGWARIVFADAR